jgi:hypothetical protein
MFKGINLWVLLLVLNNACQVCASSRNEGYSHDCILCYSHGVVSEIHGYRNAGV